MCPWKNFKIFSSTHLCLACHFCTDEKRDLRCVRLVTAAYVAKLWGEGQGGRTYKNFLARLCNSRENTQRVVSIAGTHNFILIAILKNSNSDRKNGKLNFSAYVFPEFPPLSTIFCVPKMSMKAPN